VSDRPFGRTNRVLPRVWLKLIPSNDSDDREAIAATLGDSLAVLDVSTAPALWGHELKMAEEVLMMVRGGLVVENATDSTHAADLMQAEILQQVCSLQRGRVDLFAFRLRRALEEFQMGGALDALQMARDDGLVSYVVLVPEAPDLTVLSQWQFNDAFEGVLFPAGYAEADRAALTDMAKERRVGVVDEVMSLEGGDNLRGDAVLVPVGSVSDLQSVEGQAVL
jgi:hypothetical protein